MDPKRWIALLVTLVIIMVIAGFALLLALAPDLAARH